MKIIFVNRYFDPDESATSQMLTDLARGLAARSLEVHVVCSRQLYTNPRAKLTRVDYRGGVIVHRVATTRFGRAGLAGRALDYVSFFASAGWRLLTLLGADDILIAKTDPPLISILAAVVARLKGAALVNWQQDVFPELAAHLGADPLPRWLFSRLCELRDWSLRRAKMNVLICNGMRQFFHDRGIRPSQLCVIENWADPGAVTPKSAETSQLRARLRLNDCFVVGYSGHLGRAHEIDTLLAAAEELRSDESIVFLMIGGGAKMGPLTHAVAHRRLGNFRFLPYQPREELGDSLAAADVHLVTLLPALEGLILPSKLYGVLAVGRPILFIGDPDGDIAQVIREARCGLTIAPNAGSDLVAAIRQLQSDRAICAAMGARARAALVERYTMTRAIERWAALLE
jgi:colanic acid biosynthesis glycosyl transferase WcaI